MRLPELALVDLDGTLVDSLPDIASCIDEMLVRLGLAPVGHERVREWVGNGIDVLVDRALADAQDEGALAQRHASALPLFKELYAEHTSDLSRVYDGVLEGLDYLCDAGVALGCVTNKAGFYAHKLLSELELDGYFPLVVSGDSVARKKPHPTPLWHACRHFRVEPAESLLIGDSINDVEAARAAGFHIVCVTYGYNHGSDIRASNPDALIDSLAELSNLFVPRDRAGIGPEPRALG
jgi:phosphoglycolate phosphatase